MPIDNKQNGASDKRSKLKQQEQQSRVQQSLDGSKHKLGDIEGKFGELAKVLESLNQNVDALKKVEIAQLAGDVVSRVMATDTEKKHFMNTGKWMVESNARNEAGLREISKRITLFHGFMAGDSKDQTKERLRIASLEHTDAIKKHRSVGMAQMNFLAKNKISNIAGLVSGEGFSAEAAKKLRKEWDELSRHKASKSDEKAIKRALRDNKDPRSDILFSDMGISKASSQGKREDADEIARLAKEYLDDTDGRRAHTTVIDDGTNAPKFGGGGGSDLTTLTKYVDDIDQLSGAIKANSDGMVHTLLDIKHSLVPPGGGATPIATTLGLLKVNSDAMVQMTMTMEKLAHDDMKLAAEMAREAKGQALRDKEKNREIKKSIVAGSTGAGAAGAGDSESSGGLAGGIVAGIASLFAAKGLLGGLGGKDAKSVIKEKESIKKSRAQLKADQRKLKADKAKLNKNTKLSGDKLNKANGKLNARTNRLAGRAKVLAKAEAANVGKVKGLLREIKDWTKSALRDNPKAKGAIKSIVRGGKGKKVIGALKAALRFVPGAGILIAILLMATEAAASAYFEEILREMDAEEKAAMATSQASHKESNPHEPSLDQTITGTVIETGETLRAVIKSKNAANMPSIDGQAGSKNEKPMTILNSGNTDASVTNNNFYTGPASLNPSRLNTDDLIIGR